MKYLLTICIAVLSLNSFAQEDPYEFSTFNDFYIPLQESTSLTGGMVWDDPTFTLDLPFEFELFGDTISQLMMDEVLHNAANHVENQFAIQAVLDDS